MQQLDVQKGTCLLIILDICKDPNNTNVMSLITILHIFIKHIVDELPSVDHKYICIGLVRNE